MSNRTQTLQRKCSCGRQAGPQGECEECQKKREAKVQRESTLQRKASAAGPAIAPPIVHDVLRSPGQQLDGGARARMEPLFGRSFSEVRVHTGEDAAASARAVNAAAYTVGSSIVFDSGQYSPATFGGEKLLAHELTHVVQQGGASRPDNLLVEGHESSSEREAERISAGMSTGLAASAASGLQTRRVQRTLGGALAGGLVGGLAGAAIGSIFGPIGALVGAGVGLIAGALIGNATSTRSRKLNAGEIATAKDIFKDTINYGKVEITRDSIFSAGAPRTIGNTIHLKSDSKWQNFKGDTLDLSDEASTQLRPTGEQTFIHELTHVWQYQNGGIAYMPKSIIAQIKAATASGTRNAAYDWKTAIRNGVPWEKMNPEQQAELVEDYNIALRETKKPGASPLTDPDSFRTVSELLPYIQKVQQGAGAPQFIGSSKPKVQKKAASGAANARPGMAPRSVHAVLRSSGSPLDGATRRSMEPRFGFDFASVRLHTDARAVQSARELNAAAYTVGHDIVLDTSHYAPRTASGAQLLAHELAHVVQQSGSQSPGREIPVGSSYDAEEREADKAAHSIRSSESAPVPLSRSGHALRRQAAGSNDDKKKDPKPLIHVGDWVLDPKITTPLGAGSLEDAHKGWCAISGKCGEKSPDPCPPGWVTTKGDGDKRICCPTFSPDQSRCCPPEKVRPTITGWECPPKQVDPQTGAGHGQSPAPAAKDTPAPTAGGSSGYKLKLPPTPSLVVSREIHFQHALPAAPAASQALLRGSLTEGGQTDLQLLTEWLVKFPQFGVQLTGMASSEGSNELNLKLGENRARSVANVLTGLGIDRARITEPIGVPAECPSIGPGLHNCGASLASKDTNPADRIVRARLFVLPPPEASKGIRP